MSKKSFVGTCQACFAQQVAKGSGEPKLVLHGYSRPGDGYIVGDCLGHGQLPYELSCECTKNTRTLEEGRLKALRTRRAEFANAEVVKLYIEIPNPDYNRSVRKTVCTTKTVFITPEYKGEPGTFGRDWFFFLTQAIQNLENQINASIRTIKFFAKKVADWKYAPEALKDHETVVRAEADAKALAKANKKFFADWKYAWQMVARGIDEHKFETNHLVAIESSTCSTNIKTTVRDNYNQKYGHLPSFPDAKARAAARKNLQEIG